MISTFVLTLFIHGACDENDEGLERDHQELAFIAAKKKIAILLAEMQTEKAETTFDSLTYENTSSYDYFLVGGTVKMSREKYEEALPYFKNAAGIYVTEEVYLNLAKIYRLQNDSAPALLMGA